MNEQHRTGSRGKVIRWVAAIAFGLVATVGSSSAQDAAPAPLVSVAVEKIDASNFPEVDVYFRSVDTVPSTEFHRLQPKDIRVLEAPPAGQVWTVGPVTSTNFENPIIRPLAMSLAVDQSLSVTDLLERLKLSTTRFLAGMSDNGPLADDATSLVLFCGFNNLRRVHHLPMTSDSAQAAAYANEYLTQTWLGTPLHKAWNLAVKDVAETNYPAKGVLALTDGKPWPAFTGPDPDSIIQAAVSNGVPVFNFAFVKFTKKGRVARNSVKRVDMMRMAQITGGAYFEPAPPFPLIPDLPQPTQDINTPAGIDDVAVISYGQQVVGFVKNLLKDKPDLDWGNFSRVVNAFVTPEVASAYELEQLDTNHSPFYYEKAKNLCFRHLIWIDEQLQSNTPSDVTDEDLDRYYVQQVENMFTKVRTSLKTLYRVTYRSSDPECRGDMRNVRLQIRYVTQQNLLPVELSGEGLSRYAAPKVVDEDQPAELVTWVNPESPVHGQLFGGAPAPRDGTWDGSTAIRCDVALMGPDSEGKAAVLATMDPDGNIVLSADPAGPVAALESADRQAVTTYLSHLAIVGTADVAKGTLTMQLTPKMPTCKRSPEGPLQRPVANPEATGFRKHLWYRITASVRRGYSYVITMPASDGNPGGETPARGEISMEMPAMVAFVADCTAPTLAVYLNSSRNPVTNRVESLELPQDSAALPRSGTVALTGANWDPSQNTGFSAARAENTTQFPLTVQGATVQGFFVPEDVRVNISAVARDNFDRSSDAAHLAPGGPATASHNRFSEGDAGSPEGRVGTAPFLAHVAASEAGEKPGLTLALDENGQKHPVTDSIIFRAANYPNGAPIAIEARAVDASGNVTSFRIPVHVVPLAMFVQRIDWEQRRGTD